MRTVSGQSAAPAPAASRPDSFPRDREAELEALVRELQADRDRRELALRTALAERDRARAALYESARRQNEFLATLAHELRNPLAPIRSAVQVMRLAEGDHATATAARAMIERQLKHLVRLIEDLMDVSRLTQGRLELRKERVDVANVIQLAVEANRPLLASKQHHLRIELAPEALFVEADPTRLTQVFANLLNNSAKFSDPHADICVRLVREGPWAAITVSDSGFGIRPEMLSRVFDLFTQEERPQAAPHDGLGVGLALVKHIVELHGGSVRACSEGPGMGSSFTVRLALLEAGESDARLISRSGNSGEGATRMRILVADDNFDAAQSLALMLSMEGHEVRTASNGLEALQLAQDFHPQVALLDIGMPKLDGYETARQLRQRPEGKSLLLFALTGWGQEDDKERARQAGFDRHLVKPLEPEMLNELLAPEE
ncbi:MAG TPA: response regulator [Steroidobacteraceae bacterium]|nr:response regulator [Steroidobacteraceae bacterium]